MGQQINDKHLPDIIQARHEDALAAYRQDLDDLLTQLETLQQAASESVELTAAKGLKGWLANKKMERAQQPFDPEQLPFMPLQPNPENEPKLTTEQFVAAGFTSSPMAKTAALGDFDYTTLAGAADPAWLAESGEVTLTDAIRAKAAELHYSPVEIYAWVRNHIEWLPTWGASQSAELTMEMGRGNAFDISSLTIALLRASGIPARYVHGTVELPIDQFMNWAGGFQDVNSALVFAASGGIPISSVSSGGVITKARMEHIWVEAAVDFEPSGGAINRAADAWIPMDPSFKQYEYTTGLDVIALAGIDSQQLKDQFQASSTINDTEGWMQGLDPSFLQAAQTQAQHALETWVNAHPGTTARDVLGGGKLIVQAFAGLPAGLATTVVARGAVYAEVPSALRPKISFAFSTDLFGGLNGAKSFTWSSLNNHRVTISFRPATAADEQTILSLYPDGGVTDLSQLVTTIPSYLIYVVPELRVDGEVVLTGASVRLGEDVNFAFEVSGDGARRVYPSPIVAGSYLAVAVISGGVSVTRLEDAKAKLAAVSSQIDSGASVTGITGEDILGQIFAAGVLGYFGELSTYSQVASLSQGAHMSLMHSAGTYGYVPKVSYLFGIPRSIGPGLIEMDLDRVASVQVVEGGDAQKEFNFVFRMGALSSALEHLVPEQMFATPENQGEAVSAVKALQKASQQGQRIYHITPANQSAALPNIHQSSLALNEMRQALATGKEVIAHTDPISVNGWQGAGYIIVDPATGAGAWKIAGGLNGGSGAFGDALMQIFVSLAFIISLLPFALILAVLAGPLIALAIVAIIAWSVVLYEIQALEPGPLRGILANLAWGAIGIAVGAITGGVLGVALAFWVLGSIANYYISQIDGLLQRTRYARLGLDRHCIAA